MVHPLLEGFCAACKLADRRPPWQWCEEHVHVDETSPLPGRWRADASPYRANHLDTIVDTRDIRQVRPVEKLAAASAWTSPATGEFRG